MLSNYRNFLVILCLIFPTVLLAENKNPISAGNFIEPKSEMYFDLPKKDAKNQCAEVERVLSSCNDVQKKSSHIRECGNIKIINITSYIINKDGGYDDDWQNDGRIIMNKNGEYVATAKGVDGYFAINDTNDIPYFIFLKNDKELRTNLKFIQKNNLLILKITKCSLSKI